ncbi:UTP--glucose-1-phosphate uridylyltransferase GalU [Oceanispirochaeta sp.]|jgi:UTP--glucose-1-phosphate uridylyltransferase|uniref:UTP--glucose-1-phosphate uridylyltransferase GalU n=1 Tax=Oceanispirochaeta sp. TaxID=2035350 RepID=UPI00260C9D3A|nr:UTP--glucose-1-phosphate uridylyltransferase GalU [Oceanispirochaeta sp.]MDA3958888.1 UTP--glucose-1-phosphate uridylyltransferase GalU [Oceanispirochaeta sp.]
MMIKKAVIPAAGYGTRFLPATKSQPKEMLPLVDTPTIQYVVQEAVDSGIKDILMIIGRGKRSVEEHFSRNFELEHQLREKNKLAELALVKTVPDDVRIHFVWQHDQLGLGHAISCAKDHVGNEPFAVLLGDTVLEAAAGAPPVTRQLMNVYEQHEEAVLALEEVPWEKVSRYGVMSGSLVHDNVYAVDGLIEKPSREEAPSNLVIASRYILPPEIFSALETTPPGKNSEIQLTDALKMLLQDSAIYGVKFDGIRHDMGNKLDFIKTTIHYGLGHPEFGAELKVWLKGLDLE